MLPNSLPTLPFQPTPICSSTSSILSQPLDLSCPTNSSRYMLLPILFPPRPSFSRLDNTISRLSPHHHSSPPPSSYIFSSLLSDYLPQESIPILSIIPSIRLPSFVPGCSSSFHLAVEKHDPLASNSSITRFATFHLFHSTVIVSITCRFVSLFFHIFLFVLPIVTPTRTRWTFLASFLLSPLSLDEYILFVLYSALPQTACLDDGGEKKACARARIDDAAQSGHRISGQQTKSIPSSFRVSSHGV